MVEEIINFHSSQGLKFLHISVEISATWLICSVFLCSQPPECSSVLLCRNWCRFSVCVHTLHWNLCFVLHWFRDGDALVERHVSGFHKNKVHLSSQWIMPLPGRQLISLPHPFISCTPIAVWPVTSRSVLGIFTLSCKAYFGVLVEFYSSIHPWCCYLIRRNLCRIFEAL